MNSPFVSQCIDTDLFCFLVSFGREALQTSTLAYLSSHYHDGVASVFSAKDTSNRFIIQIVANKYNPSNFWYVLHFPPLQILELTMVFTIQGWEVAF